MLFLNLEWTKSQFAKYPENRAASCVMPFLHKAQEQNHGWVSIPIMEYIADMDQVLDRIKQDLRPGDVLMTMGAGNINQLGDAFMEESLMDI